MTGDRTTTAGSVGMERAEGARNALKTPPHEAVERLEELAKARLSAVKNRATPNPGGVECHHCGTVFIGDEGDTACGICRAEDDYRGAANPQTILQLIAHLRQVEEREAVMREAGAGLLKAYRALLDHAADDEFDMAADHPASWASRMEAALTHSPETDGEG